MTYLFATEHPDYSDLASGRVLYSLANHPAFPIRLASEIFQRCLAIRKKEGLSGRCVLYDPCCGAGYLVTVLGYLHRAEIGIAAGSDVDARAAVLAGKNLGLLQTEGLERRQAEISALINLYGKESHHEALRSCQVMQEKVNREESRYPLSTSAFQADAFDAKVIREKLNGLQVDIVLTDVPYGLHSDWQGLAAGEAIPALLQAMRAVLAPGGLVAVAADKQQKIGHDSYQRLDRFQVGKRRVVILKPV